MWFHSDIYTVICFIHLYCFSSLNHHFGITIFRTFAPAGPLQKRAFRGLWLYWLAFSSISLCFRPRLEPSYETKSLQRRKALGSYVAIIIFDSMIFRRFIIILNLYLRLPSQHVSIRLPITVAPNSLLACEDLQMLFLIISFTLLLPPSVVVDFVWTTSKCDQLFSEWETIASSISTFLPLRVSIST